MAADGSFETLTLEQRSNILICRLSRPHALNAVDDRMHTELEELFSRLCTDDSIDVVVLGGEGRAFCVGGDLRAMASGELGSLENAPAGGLYTRGALRLIRNLLAVPQPIVASLNGDAMGLGATLAFFCDIVLAADTARISDPHVSVGLVAGDGGAVIWPLLAGPNRAKEYLLTGDRLTAQEAERIGLVNRVHPAEELWAETMALAERLAAGASAAIRWTKLSINKVLWERVVLSLDTSLALEALSTTTKDHREGVSAFLEKRPPKYIGR